MWHASEMLGRRLEMESDGNLASDAHLCYIVSGNTEQLVASWDRVLADSAGNSTLQVMFSQLPSRQWLKNSVLICGMTIVYL